MLPMQRRALYALLSLTWVSGVCAQSSDDEDLALSYGDKSVVSIATGSQQPISRAPAVATVITSREIEAMGVSQLEQVLESVPGLHVSMWSAPLNPIYSFRGIHTGYNPQVLMLVNGIPITNAFLGDRSQIWGGMPVENIARIEVIRGPGSALYGADAFAGVINVITKTAADINGTEFGVRAGSFDSQDAWLQHATKLGPVQAAFYVGAGKTGGHKEVIERDIQTTLDGVYGTNVSRAPGPISAYRNGLDTRADLSYENWRFRAAYQQRKVGVGVGLADSLDPDSRARSSRLYLDLTHTANIARNWEVNSTLGYYDIKDKPGDPAFVLYPPGAFGGSFPNGVIGNPGHSERHTHASVSAFHTGLDNHRIRLGAGYRNDNLYEIVESKNFSFIAIPGIGPVILPLPGLVDATGNPALIFNKPHTRTLRYIFVQDEWKIASDWVLTAGVRHDRYSDFGGTTNPRVALVWDAAYNVVVKAMHGRAFRAPNFTELYGINNPVAIGNPNLQPETIVTNELAFSWQVAPSVQMNLNLFDYGMRDIIRFVPNADPTTGSTAQNTGRQHGRGLEFEATWDATRTLRVTGSVSLQRSTDEATQQDVGLTPHKRVFLRGDWRFAPLWQLGTTVNHVADRRRQPGDARPPVSDYTTVDLTMRREKVADNWDVRATVLNLFDRDAREPTFVPGNVPFDLPLPGRAFYLQAHYRF